MGWEELGRIRGESIHVEDFSQDLSGTVSCELLAGSALLHSLR